MLSAPIRKQAPAASVAAAAAAATLAATASLISQSNQRSDKHSSGGSTEDRARICDNRRVVDSNGNSKDIKTIDKSRFLNNLHLAPPSIAACEGGTKFHRRQTLRWFDETATKKSLASRYNVDWNNPLGEGGFGSVYLCTDRETGEKCALKKIPKQFTDKEAFQKEIDALLHVRESGSHPNICQLKENFDEGGMYYLALDLISGGELFDHLAQNGQYSELDAARLVREVASALAFIHGGE